MAQCLEYDLCAQAKTPEDVLYEFERILFSHIIVSTDAGEDPFAILEPAPEEYWKRFHEAGVRAQNIKRLPFRLPQGSAATMPEDSLEIRLAA